MCVHIIVHSSTVIHNTAQHISDYFPYNLQTTTKAWMLSTGGEGELFAYLLTKTK